MTIFKSLVFVLLLLLCFDLILSFNEEDNYPEVQTKLGLVKGSILKTRLGKKVYAFRGLKYAEPPIGSLRFKPPVPIKPWKKVFDASKESPACPQEVAILQSEDCLTLNIYTKEIRNITEKLPVIVHVHTGAFYKYSSQSFLFGPYYLLDEDIVLVSINYRLGSLGFLNTGDDFATGNYGFKDQVAALRFIQKHIDSFGGDPNSVTFTGQSAGSRSLILHMLSPMSKGLFHRAIGMSGAPTTIIPPQREQLDVAIKQANLLNCSFTNKEQMYQCLMEKPAEDYGKTAASMKIWHSNPLLTWYPSIEPEVPGVERFLSDDPVKLIKEGPINSVPLIFGITKDEYATEATDIIKAAMNGNDSDFQALNDRWYELAPICFMYERNTPRSKYISDQLSKFYFNNKPISLENYDKLRKLFGNALGHFPYYRAAKLLAQYSAEPIYFYDFTYLSPKLTNSWKLQKGEVAHGDDLHFLFKMKNPVYSNKNEFPVYSEKDSEIFMVKRLTKMWAHFAKTGEPLPKDAALFGNVTWERLTLETKKYLVIDKELVIKTDFMHNTMEFWEHLFP